MALTTFSIPRGGFVGALPQEGHFAPAAAELSLHKLQSSPLKARRRPSSISASLSTEREAAEYHSQRPPTPLLDTVNYPIHMKNLSLKELQQLADELRSDVIFHVSKTGGHLGSSLGVVELTVALHYVFNTPQDKILWDVGHQSYPHKILTGRRDKMPTMRQTNGLSGFTKRSESEYDSFGTGHSSTTISAALGMAVGRDLKGGKNNVVAVIGDGAMTAGQAYEAMNNAGYLDSDMIVILNDNKQVSLPTATLDGPVPPVGALSSALSKLQSSRPLRELREVAKGVTKQIGGSVHELAAKVDEYARGMISGSGSTLFEELGLYYIGPVDGHNIDDLITILREVKSTKTTGPVLIHVVTEKGRGYPYAERAADKYHGVAKFDPATGKQFKSPAKTLSYTNYFAEALIAEAEQDSRIVAIHAAMGGGTGLNYFLRRFPNRCFDVGIAEQHAVTFAAGLACEGLKPFCAIYSSFLQRGYDQVVHDVDLQKLPVRFAMDRAGLVGADGPTHCGAFDVTYMACLPNMVVMAPSDEAELCHIVATAAAIDDRPSCFRYPRGNGIGVPLPPNYKGVPLEVRHIHPASRRPCMQISHWPAPVAGVVAGWEREGTAGGGEGGAAGVRVGGAVLPRRRVAGGAARPQGDRRRRKVLQAAGPGAHQEAGQLPRGAPHRGGRLHRRVRLPRRAVHGPRWPPRRQTQVAAAGATRPIHRPRVAGGSAGGGRADAVAHRRDGVQRAGPGEGGARHHDGAQRLANAWRLW